MNVVEGYMKIVKLLVLGAGAALYLVACSKSPEVASDDAPEAAMDAIDPRDEGTDWNGWSQEAFVMVNVCGGGPNWLWHNLNRSWGDATRGGGVCLVANYGSACSTDAECHASATAGWGPSVYGYCYQGNCYARPGSQGDWCVLNPNRAPGQLNRTIAGSSSYFALGCMTKNAGLNAACGTTNTSQYMRTLSSNVWSWEGCEW
jgi:hypothetical protein